MTGKALPSPSSVTVSVLNGTGQTGQAGQTMSALKALGFDTIGQGDARGGASPSETIVYYSSPGNQAAAEQVMHSLSGTVTMGQGPTADGAQVTVVTGSNFSVAAPASTGATAPTSSSTGSSSASSASSLGTPTAPTQPLSPFDPRSCTASGGEGP